MGWGPADGAWGSQELANNEFDDWCGKKRDEKKDDKVWLQSDCWSK